ncbi:MAG: HAMP domain-containing methyl-accepting chemotaxis protein [Smithellaceae bacterium]|nr:HAMP domain-containing methyl-accepting chemotaxis protein [Smithellaceae bacterium]
MNFKDLSLKTKIMVPVVAIIFVGIILTVFVTISKTRQIVMDEAVNSTMAGYRDTTWNAFIAMKKMGNFKDGRTPFIEKMKHIADIRVIRSEGIDKDYGKGLPEEYPKDAVEKEVLEKGVEKVSLEGEILRGVYPYSAKSDHFGTNCLTCHTVKEGTVLGALEIKIPLKRSFAAIKSSRNLYLGLGALGVMSMALVLFIIIGRALKPLANLVGKVQQLSDGDLRTSIDHGNNDEIGILARNMNNMVGALNKMIKDILASAGSVASASSQLSGSSQRMSKGVAEQSGRAAQIATSSTEMSQTVIDIASNASNIAFAATEAAKTAKEGGEVVARSVEEVKAIADTVNESAQMVASLGERSKQIGEIVRVINDIADQTNLLALNAAIEAARAGEQGRGFAVVADEVRKLAERTAKATLEIGKMIMAIQDEVKGAVEAMDKGTERVNAGVEYSTRAGIALTNIVTSVDGLQAMVQQIATATEQMSTVSETISSDIETIAVVSKETSTSSDQIARSSSDLARLATELTDIVGQFKV